MNRRDTNIITEAITPEVNPKINTVLFIACEPPS
jgi:hypothetical protein